MTEADPASDSLWSPQTLELGGGAWRGRSGGQGGEERRNFGASIARRRLTAVAMYLLALHVRFVSEVLSIDRYSEDVWDRLGRDRLLLLRGGRRVPDRSFVIPAFAMMGALAWQANEKSMKSRVFRGFLRGDRTGIARDLSSLRVLCLRPLSACFCSHHSLHPFKY